MGFHIIVMMNFIFERTPKRNSSLGDNIQNPLELICYFISFLRYKDCYCRDHIKGNHPCFPSHSRCFCWSSPSGWNTGQSRELTPKGKSGSKYPLPSPVIHLSSLLFTRIPYSFQRGSLVISKIQRKKLVLKILNKLRCQNTKGSVSAALEKF